jgi:hypothetical protein
MHISLGFSLENRTVDMDVVPLARSQQRAVGTKRNGRVVVILRTMRDTNALHGHAESNPSTFAESQNSQA